MSLVSRLSLTFLRLPLLQRLGVEPNHLRVKLRGAASDGDLSVWPVPGISLSQLQELFGLFGLRAGLQDPFALRLDRGLHVLTDRLGNLLQDVDLQASRELGAFRLFGRRRKRPPITKHFYPPLSFRP